MCIYWAELWRLSSEFGHTITGNGTSKPIFMFSVPSRVSPQINRERAFKVALVTFLWRYFIVHFQMCPKNTCPRRCIVTLVTYICLAFLQCVFSNVFSDHLPEKMHNRIGCIFWHFSTMCFLVYLKSSAWEDPWSHCLHFFGVSSLRVFKCVLKVLTQKDAKSH